MGGWCKGVLGFRPMKYLSVEYTPQFLEGVSCAVLRGGIRMGIGF
jgi:hypothetical protein